MTWQNAGSSTAGLDHKSIVAMSQICTEDAENTARACHLALSFLIPATEDLDAKMREKSSLTKQLAELKRSKLQCPESCCGSRHNGGTEVLTSNGSAELQTGTRRSSRRRRKMMTAQSCKPSTWSARRRVSEELLTVKPVREF